MQNIPESLWLPLLLAEELREASPTVG